MIVEHHIDKNARFTRAPREASPCLFNRAEYRVFVSMRTQLYTVRVVVPHNGTFLVGNFAGAHAAREWMDKIKRRLVCELTLERGAHSQSGPTEFERFHKLEKRDRCPFCGELKPVDHSCVCFDNYSE